MAASTRANSAGFSKLEKMTSAQANTIDTNAAAGVRRDSTGTGARSMPLALVGLSTTATFMRVSGGSVFFNTTTATATTWSATFDLLGLPPGHELTQTIVRVQPAVGPHAAAPAKLPHATLYTVATYGTVSTVGTASYTWVSTAAYEAAWSLPINTPGHTIASGKVYRIEVRSETGQYATGTVTMKSIICSVTPDLASGGADFTFWV